MMDPPRTIEWETDALDLTLVINEDGVVCLRHLLPHREPKPVTPSPFFMDSDLPLVSVRMVGEGNTIRDKTAKCLIGTYLSARLRYCSHKSHLDDKKASLDVTSEDQQTGIQVVQHFVVYRAIPVLRSSATITNTSPSSSCVVTQLSSLTLGGLTAGTKDWVHEYSLMTANNSWFREAQWREDQLSALGIDDNGLFQLGDGHHASFANYTVSSRGSFSTGTYLPMGLLKNQDENDVLLWQIEHNGSWRWEIGDYKDSLYLALGGPTSLDHDCKVELQAGKSFETVPAALCRVRGGVTAAFRALTQYRRQIRRPHEDNEALPIIFNDYMNCLMGDPDEQKIQALLDPVARSGAKFFVIDAGWYADDSNWWDDVGLWEPSTKRFPSGFKRLLNMIRSRGLVPGLWVEPEVVGVRSVVSKRLPNDAFFQEGGQRVIEKGRYQLDYRHPAVREWMNSVMHRLVVECGAGYFKFDYNIEVLQGTDVQGTSAGAAHLEHQRAYLSWVQELLDRYPGVVIENCSSGAQRMEYAMLSTHSVQSTSDQQDPVLYAAIAAAIPTAVVPEQSASWAYPSASWSDEINCLTMVNSLLGRVCLSGRLDELSPHQLHLVNEGMRVYQSIRLQLKYAYPIWPLGLPQWHDEWLCLGMVTESDGIYLAVWRRGGATSIRLSIPSVGATSLTEVRLLYPSSFDAKYDLNAEGSELCVQLPNNICARLFHLTT